MQVTVVGAGTMGAGIAQLAAMSGHDTTVVDLDPGQLERASATRAASLQRFVKKGTLSQDEATAVEERVQSTVRLAEGVAAADVVVESVVEVLEVKQAVFREAAAA